MLCTKFIAKFLNKIIKIGYKNFKLDREKLYRILNKSNIRIIFIPNPNQPIEDNLSLKELRDICKICKKIRFYWL